MVGMWVGMPLLGLLLYFVLPSQLPMNTAGMTGQEFSLPASTFLSLMLSSTGGLLAATLVSIDIVNEKNKKVYDLFLIRPINRGSFMWAKFFAVTFCVTVALGISMFAGILVDVMRGVEISPLMQETIVEKFIAGAGVVMISTAAGILIGMLSSTVLMAVMLVWFIGQYVMLIPMLASMISNNWVMTITLAITLILSVLFVYVSSMIFKRMET
jgi:ABC-type transport system involved in multi-copper enzyme maturation permease subunit